MDYQFVCAWYTPNYRNWFCKYVYIIFLFSGASKLLCNIVFSLEHLRIVIEYFSGTVRLFCDVDLDICRHASSRVLLLCFVAFAGFGN